LVIAPSLSVRPLVIWPPYVVRVVARLVARGTAGSALVLLGGVLTATLPRTTPLLNAEGVAPVLEALRGTTAGRMLGLTLVLVGLGLLATAWLTLCRRVSTAPVVGIDQVRLCVMAWSLPLLIAPPLFSRDGWSYVAVGALKNAGLSPYVHAPADLSGPLRYGVDPMWMFTTTPYGPLPLAYGSGLVELTRSPWLVAIGHRGFALIGLALLAWAVPRLASWSGANPAFASALVIASPLMLTNGVAGMHNDLLMVGLMAAALVVAAERGWFAGAALAGLAAAVKAPGGLVAIGIVLVTVPLGAGLLARLRRAGAVAVVSAGVLVGLGVATGVGVGWIEALTVPGVVDTPLSVTTLLGNGIDAVAGTEQGFRDVLRALGTLAGLAVATWLTLTRATGDRQAALSAVAVSMFVIVTLSPVVHIWYFLWWLPFVASLRLSRIPLTALVGLSVVFGLVAPLDSSLHGAYDVIVFGSLLVAALTGLALLTPASRRRLERILDQAVAPTPAPSPAAEPSCTASIRSTVRSQPNSSARSRASARR
jgi:hypothetical protein